MDSAYSWAYPAFRADCKALEYVADFGSRKYAKKLVCRGSSNSFVAFAIIFYNIFRSLLKVKAGVGFSKGFSGREAKYSWRNLITLSFSFSTFLRALVEFFI